MTSKNLNAPKSNTHVIPCAETPGNSAAACSRVSLLATRLQSRVFRVRENEEIPQKLTVRREKRCRAALKQLGKGMGCIRCSWEASFLILYKIYLWSNPRKQTEIMFVFSTNFSDIGK